MEIIKKRICLENFISRIPGMNDVEGIEDTKKLVNGSWGYYPKDIVLWGKRLKYHTLISLYYSALNVIMYSKYFEYDASGKKWLELEIDWRDTFLNVVDFSYASALPEDGLKDRMKVGITTQKNVTLFYDTITALDGNYHDGFDLIDAVNKIIGRIIVPYAVTCTKCGHSKIGTHIKRCESCDGTNLIHEQAAHVPYFLYWKEIDRWIDLLNSLKTTNCCEKNRYNDYGGDAFLTYLENLKTNGFGDYIFNTESPTIDIPVLLTATHKTIGNYRTNDVDVVDEDGREQVSIGGNKDKTSGVVKTVGESKLATLKRRRKSTDDNGQYLPFIMDKDDAGKTVIQMPYKTNMPMNVDINGQYVFGDMIVSMVETCTGVETKEDVYLILIEKLTDEQYEKDKGSLSSPVTGIMVSEVKPDLIQYGSKDKNTFNEVINFYEKDSISRVNTLCANLIQSLEKEYPRVLCFKQEYRFDYELIYGVEDYDAAYEDAEGNIITPIKEEKTNKTCSGTLYVRFKDPQITVTYVLGAKMKIVKNKMFLNEENIFNLHKASYPSWNGTGIWYRETFPMKKLCTESFLIDGVDQEITYDAIDLDKQSYTYEFPGIDFPRKDYILCNEIMYKGETYKKIATNDVIFRDEKMLSIDFPLREKYDVTVERGTSAAFEKHLQLSEVKTWQDLENYRNGMFLNK